MQKPTLLLAGQWEVWGSQIRTWIVHIHLTRGKVKETLRFIKQSDSVKDIRVLRYQSGNKLVLVTAVGYFAATSLGQKLKLKILGEKLLIISRSFTSVPPFRSCELADGVKHLLTGSSPCALLERNPNLQLELRVEWDA